MRWLLTASCACLLLVGCGKPSSSGGQKEADAPVSSEERGGQKLSVRSLEAAPPAITPDEIIERAEKIEPPAEREKALAHIAWNAMETDPGLAHDAFLRLPAGSPEKIRLIQHYAMNLVDESVDAALEWAASLTTEAETSAAYAQIAIALAEEDPGRAAILLSETGITGREFDVAVVQVVQRWAGKSAPDAAAWVTAFPPGAAREAGMGVIAGRWLPLDAPAALGWFASLKDPEMRSEAARAMEGVILQQAREVRESWLEHADAGIRAELERQRDRALLDVGDNVPRTGD